MANYILSEETFSDIREIWYYTIDKWSEAQAEKYVIHLYEQFDFIYKNPTNPRIFKPTFNKNYHCYRYQRHIIFFKFLNDERVDVIRILHDNMNLPHHILD